MKNEKKQIFFQNNNFFFQIQEMDKQKRTSNLNSKEFRELSYQLNEKRSANQKLQSQNSALNDEIK